MSLFDNPMVRNAKENMSKELQDDYKTKGKMIYETIDFTTSKLYNEGSTELQKIIKSIESGLSFDDLDEEDVNILKNNLSMEEIEKLKK